MNTGNPPLISISPHLFSSEREREREKVVVVLQ